MIFYVCVLCVFSQLSVTAFLLQPDHTSSLNASKQHCVSLQEFMAENKELKHRINQLEHDNEQTLNMLTKQLQEKFSLLEYKINETAKHNETAEKSDILENKLRGIEENHTLLKQAHEVHNKDLIYMSQKLQP